VSVYIVGEEERDRLFADGFVSLKIIADRFSLHATTAMRTSKLEEKNLFILELFLFIFSHP